MSGPARKTAPPWIVFTDLDGTLLDAKTYSAEPARGALALLAKHRVPVVLCSSKTAAEQRVLRRHLGLETAPFVVENGSAILVPEPAGLAVADWPRFDPDGLERVRVLGQPAAFVRQGLARVAAATGLPLTGYADLSDREVAALTGLDPTAAARARRRDFSETLVADLTPAQWAAVETALEAEGLTCRHGGRFRTVTGTGADKGAAVRILIALYSAAGSGRVLTAGLGDSANDEGLLSAVDRPYLIARDHSVWTSLAHLNARRIGRPGPLGWADAITDLLATQTSADPKE